MHEKILLGILIVSLIVVCVEFNIRYEKVLAGHRLSKIDAENVHKVVNEYKKKIDILAVAIDIHRHGMDGTVYFLEEECKKYCK